MRKEWKRLLTLLVAAAMLFSMMPMGAVAQEQTQTETQTSTSTDADIEALEPVSPSEPEENTGATTPDDSSGSASGGSQEAVPDTTTSVAPEEPSLPDVGTGENPGTGTDDGEESERIDVSNATDLEEGMATEAMVRGDGTWTLFRFVPAQTGTYTFTDLANQGGAYVDTRGELYDATGRRLHSDDDGGMYNSFMITCELTAGEVYYLGVRFWDAYTGGSFPVKVFRFHVAGLSVEPLELEDHVDGCLTDAWDEEHGQHKFYQYQWWDRIRYTVTMGDGTQVSGEGATFGYDGMEFQLDWNDDQNSANVWTAGNTYTAGVSIGGVSAETQITITPCTIASAAFFPISIRENTRGNLQMGWDEEQQCSKEYYEYFWWNELRYTVTFVNGETVEGNGGSFYYNGKNYNLDYLNTQNATNPWTVGNTYNAEVYVGLVTASVPVTIEASNVASIVANPVTLAEGTNGAIHGEWNPETESNEEYFRYYWWNNLTCQVTFTDGTTITVNGPVFHYNGEEYQMDCWDSQGPANVWTVGNTYTAQLGLDSATCDVSVTIDSSPIASVSVYPITMMENTCGGMTSEWNEQTQNYEEYYRYWWWNELHYDVTFQDGTVYTDHWGTSINYNGEVYNLSHTDSQNVQNKWTAGNTYAETLFFGSVSATVNITVEASPIAGIQAYPVTIPASAGYVTRTYNPETGYSDKFVYIYDWQNYVTYDVTMKDGTVLTGLQGCSFEYNGKSYFVERWDNQEDSSWTPGNTYEASLGISGAATSAPVTVTIASSPFASVTLAPITLVENTGGYLTTGWNEHTQQEETYYRYNWNTLISYTVTDVDGNVQSGSGNGVWYDGQPYNFQTEDGQDWEHWTVGNTYTAPVFLCGVRCDVAVTVIESPVQSVTVEPVALEENTNGYYRWDASGKYYYYENWYQSLQFTVLLKDGTVLKGAYGQPVFYEGQHFCLEDWWHDQDNEHWYVDNTYEAGVRIGGQEYPVYVTICASTEHNSYEYLVQNGQVIITGCTAETTLLQIPETINGYPVVGVTGLGKALRYAEEIRFPDSVTMLSASLFWETNLPLKKLCLGSGISSLTQDSVWELSKLEWIEVSPENPYYTGIGGVVYDEEVTALLVIPAALQGSHVVPDSVTDVENLIYMNSETPPDVQLGSGVTDYKMVDGVIYNADMTSVIRVTASAAGEYVMPDSVEWINEFAFSGSNLTSVVLSNNVVNITYGAFFNSPLLEEITIPASVQSVEPVAFGGCNALNKVHISDMAAWCGVMFYFMDCNPLYYAHDLYLNGELVTDLVIPETVERDISQYVFAGGSMESVTIPSNVLAIGPGAFAECTNLKQVNIPDLGAWSSTVFGNESANPLHLAHDLYLNGEKVTDLVLPETVANRAYPMECPVGVGKYAFTGASIETVTVPSYVQTIGLEAFYGCDNLTQVHVEDLAAWAQIDFHGLEANPLYLAHDLYVGGEKVTDLVLPETVGEVVYSYAFAGGSMTSLTVPAAVYRIGNYAFAATAVEQVSFAEGLGTIGFAAFRGSNLQSLELPDSLGWISDSAFDECTSLQNVTFGSNLQEIGGYAFSESGLTAVTLPDSLNCLGMAAFRNCTALQSVELGSGLTEIIDEAFRGCGLKTLTIPQQMTCVGMDSFRDNTALTELNIDSDNLQVIYGAFANCPLGELELSNITYIGGEAFSGAQATQLKLPASAVMLTYREFAFNDNLVSVTLPAGIEFINSTVFQGSSNISHVLFTGTAEQWNNIYCRSEEINNAVLHIGAVGNEVTTQQTCTTIRFYCSICDTWETVNKSRAAHTFNEEGACIVCGHDKAWEYTIDEAAGTVTVTDYSGNDTEVQMPDTIEGLPVVAFTSQVFSNDRQLLAVTLPEAVTQIPDEAFRGCRNLERISLGSQITSVGRYAFCDCENLQAADLPDTVTSISDFAFHNCHMLEMEALPAELTHVGESAFGNCGRITLRTLPKGVTNIAYATFAGCSSLEEIVLPNTVTNIVYQAFQSCYGLTHVTIGENVISMGDDIFLNCESLELICFLGEKPDIADAAIQSGITVFYPASESWADTNRTKWYACQDPTVTAQPEAVDGWLGDTAVLQVAAEGQRLRYQWYMAAPNGNFTEVGSNSAELLVELTEASAGSRAFCQITDVLGRSAQTETVTLDAQEKPVMQITTLPTKLDYLLGEELDNTDMVVTLTWADGTSQTLESYDLTGYDPNVAGEQTITVSYKGLTATYKVTVTDPYSGTWGTNIAWKFSEGVLTLSGTGAVKNCTVKNQPWKDLRGEITAVVVEEGITSLGNYTLYFCRKVTSVTLPASLTAVGTGAFYSVSALTDVYYAGTMEQWNAVTVAADNDPLANATLHTTEVVTGIDIVFGPDKTEYWLGQELDLTGLEMNYLLSDGQIVPLVDGYTISGYNPNTAGEQTVTVTYEGFTATFTVTLKEATLQEVIVSTLPNKTVYQQGEALDTTGMVLTVVWSDGTCVPATEGFGIANYDPNVLGEQTVSVFYRGMQTTFTVTVEGQSVTLTGFYVHISPDKLEYLLGEELDLTGIVLMAEWSDGTTTQITEEYAVAGYDPTVLGQQSVSIYYRGMCTGFGVTVKAPAIGGELGENLTWTLFDGTLTISGTGAMPDFEMEDRQPWWNDRDQITNVVIEEGVTSIGAMAFYSNSQIRTITIPESLSTIGVAAFHYTSNMTGFCVDEKNPCFSTDEYGFLFNKDKTTLVHAVRSFSGHYTVPEGVMGIGAEAFATCFNLTGISFPSTLQSIGKEAFSACWELTSVTLPDNVTYIGENAFSDCRGLTELVLPANLITIEACAFSYCANLQAVTIPDQVTTIGVMAFIGCSGITEITLPVSLTEIGSAVFLDCSGLTDVYYLGSAEQWAQINLESDNEYLSNANIHFAVESVVLIGITVIPPNKTEYWITEGLLTEGMVVTANYSDGSTREITEYFINGYDPYTAGEQTVTISYEGFTADFTVTVSEQPLPEPEFVRIDVTAPEKTLYWVGEELDLTGMVVTALYNNQSTQVITEGYTVSGFDSTTPGEKEIRITYNDSTDIFVITVKELVNEEVGQVIIDNANGIAGRTVDVKLTLQNNPGIASMSLKVHFDSSVLILTEVLDGGILGENAHKPEMTSPYTLSWVNDLATENFTENGTLVTLRFTIAEDAPEGIYTIVATYDADSGDIMDKDLLDVEMEIISGSVNVSKLLIGDVNGDGEISARDRAVLTRYLADWEGYADQVDLQAADVNQDGSVDTRDRAILTRYLADWEGYNQLPYSG